MKLLIYIVAGLLVLAAGSAVPSTARAVGGSSWQAPVVSDPDLDQARIAIREKNWDKAVDLLNKALAPKGKKEEKMMEMFMTRKEAAA